MFFTINQTEMCIKYRIMKCVWAACERMAEEKIAGRTFIEKVLSAVYGW